MISEKEKKMKYPEWLPLLSATSASHSSGFNHHIVLF